MRPAASSPRQVGVSSCRSDVSVVAGDSHPMATVAVKALGRQHLLAPLRSAYRPNPVGQLGADWLLAIYDLASETSNELGFPNSYCCLCIVHVKSWAPLLAEAAAGQQRNAENVLQYLHRRGLPLSSARICSNAETATGAADVRVPKVITLQYS